MADYEEIKITGGPRTRTNRKRQKPPPVSKDELKSGFYHGYRGLGALIKSEEFIPEKEFENMADAYESVAKRFPMLGYIVLVMAPLSVIGEMYDKAMRIWEKRHRFLKSEPNVVDAEHFTVNNANDHAA